MIITSFSSRKIFFSAFVLCLILFAAAYWVQERFGLMPCPLCMLQRIIAGTIAIITLIAFIHNPKKIGRIIYALFGLICSLLGLGLAMRQIWLQHQPPDENAACLPGLKFIFQSMPFGKAIKAILHGSEECKKVRWHFLSLTLPEWSALAFIILAIIMLILIFKNKNNDLYVRS
jgi:disulfide bond formation protein DsbB